MFKNIRKLTMLLFMALTMMTLSCNKDKEETSVNLVGDWKCVIGSVYDIQEDITTSTGVGHILKLADNGNWYEDGILKGYYVTTGNSITLNKNEGVTNSRFDHQYTYVVTSSNLTLDYSSSSWNLHFEFDRI